MLRSTKTSHKNSEIFKEIPPVFKVSMNLAHIRCLSPCCSAHSVPCRRSACQSWLLEALPSEFDRQTYTELATTLGINSRTADRIIRRWCDSGQLENIAHGKYRKKELQQRM